MKTIYAVGLATLYLLSKKEKVTPFSLASTGYVSRDAILRRIEHLNTPAGFYASQLKKHWNYENQGLKVG
jgi:hypothetical protein